MKYLDEYRDGAAAREAGGRDRADRHPAVDDHGSLRRPDAHDRQVRDRPDPAAGRRAGARAGLPGLRHPARDDRPGARDRLAARRHLLLVRRHAPRARARAATCLQLKSQGSDVRIVYSPLDAVNLAAANPDRQVVFFAIGFETTAPANAMAVWLAQQRRLANFSVLVSHVLVPPVMTALLEAPDNRVQGFLGPGPCLHRHGLWRIRAARPRLSRADRDHRLRAARPARRHLVDASGSSKRAAPRSRTRTPGPSGPRATPRPGG